MDWEAAGFPDKTDDPRVYDMYRRNWGMKNREDITDYLVANQLQYEIQDRQLGRLLAYLKERNLYDSTMIVFTADHGEMNSRKGCIDKGAYLKPQVPLYVKPAGTSGKQDPLIIGAPCSLLDICSTMLNAAGISVPERVDGRNLFDSARGISPARGQTCHG